MSTLRPESQPDLVFLESFDRSSAPGENRSSPTKEPSLKTSRGGFINKCIDWVLDRLDVPIDLHPDWK